MTTPARPRPTGRGTLVAGIAAVSLVLLLLGQAFGRAEPDHNYRPPLPPDAIETGCYPLPGGARLSGLAYQVRRDRDVAAATGQRRELTGHYDLVERDEALRLLVAAFTDAGFSVASEEVDDAAARAELRSGDEVIGIVVREIPDTSAETLVRGEFVLDLPVVELARPDDPDCARPSSTKRWPEPEVPSWLLRW